ncbi:MAG TPA: response regulator, partial [Herpetosiphonaceae bacterium]|nr:response regulator [Herpetosiphonaceae bacterium]
MPFTLATQAPKPTTPEPNKSLDGFALLRRLAEIGSDLPVIVMTGHGDVPIAVRALKAGAVDFLEKPFDDEHLI